MDSCELKADLVYKDGPRTVIVTYSVSRTNHHTNSYTYSLLMRSRPPFSLSVYFWVSIVARTLAYLKDKSLEMKVT